MGVNAAGEACASLRAIASWPNPFDASATISFEVPVGLPRETRIVLRVYDVAGRCLRTVVDGPRPGGRQTVQWDGRGDDGVEVPAGVYFYQVEVGGERVRGRVVVVR